MDYASPVTKLIGEDLISKEVEKIPNPKIRDFVKKHLVKIENGERDFRI